MAVELEPRFAGLPATEYPGGLVVIEASTRKSRTLGLSRLDHLDGNHALRIPSCSAIHMFGMRFGLDLIWLRKDGTVARIDRNVGRRRLRFCPSARSVIETVAGRADAFVNAGVGSASAPF
jgi:uncharacterized membrane protein (UPF0127 family)